MKRVPLGEVAEFVNGHAFKPADWGQTGLPIIRIQNLSSESAPFNYTTKNIDQKFIVEKNDLLVSWSATLGVFVWTRTPKAFVNQHIFKVVPAPMVDRDYLMFQLQGALIDMERYLHGATMKHVNRKEFLSTTIPLPSLKEQKRIAALLDKADAIRAKRRQILAHLNSLTQSIFHHMFSNEECTSTVEEVCAKHQGAIRTGPFGSQLLHSEFVDDGIAVLGLDNVVGNEFSWGTRRFITQDKYEKLSRYTVYPGDVLISIMGTTGRCVVVPSDIPIAINTKHICAITLDIGIMLPEVLRASFLWHPVSRQYLRQQTKGSIMDGLNMGIIKRMPISVPLLSEQRKFVERTRRLTSIHKCVQSTLEKDNELFASLQARAFRGEL